MDEEAVYGRILLSHKECDEAAACMQPAMTRLCGITHRWNLKYGTSEPVYELEIESKTEQTGGCPGEGGGRNGVRGWGSRCKLLYIEWKNNKVLPYSTGNYFQYSMISPMEKNYVSLPGPAINLSLPTPLLFLLFGSLDMTDLIMLFFILGKKEKRTSILANEVYGNLRTSNAGDHFLLSF